MKRSRNTIKVPSSTEARTGPWSVPMRKQHAMKYDGIMASVALISTLYAWFTIQFTLRPMFIRMNFVLLALILTIPLITTPLERLLAFVTLFYLYARYPYHWENRRENRCLGCRVHPPGRNRNKNFRYQRRYLRRRIIPIHSSRHTHKQGLSKNYAYVEDIPLYAIAELPDCRIRGHHFHFNEKLKTDNENDRRTPQRLSTSPRHWIRDNDDGIHGKLFTEFRTPERLSTSYRDNDDGDRHIHGKLFMESHF